MIREYNVVIEVQAPDKAAIWPPLLFFRKDNDGQLRFAITNAGVAVDPATLTATCTFKRPSGESLIEDRITVDNGQLVCPVASGVLDEIGEVQGTLEVYQGAERLTPGRFELTVLEDLQDDSTHAPTDLAADIGTLKVDVGVLKDDVTGLEAISGAAVAATQNANTATTNAIVAAGEAEQVVEQVDVHVGAAALSAQEAAQALSDLLAMIGIDIASLVGGKVPMTQIPATAIQDIHEVADDSGLTSLTAQRGDLAEVIELVDGVKTVTKTYQLLGDGDATVRDNWVIWGTSYAVQAGNATTATNAENANTINNKRIVGMTQSQYDIAAIDPDTIYVVVPD